jgi:O-antigen ligase
MIELLFALFLLSGLIKFFVFFLIGNILVIDFTLLCAIALLGGYIFHFIRNSLDNKFYIVFTSRSIVFTLLVFYMWIILTLTYTNSPDYCYMKTLRFLTLVIALAFPLLYRNFEPGRFFHLFVYTGSILIFIYTALLPHFYAGYLRSYEYKEFVGKYLDIGYLSGIIILLLAFACPHIKRLPKILLLAINASALLVSAARGAIIFLAFVLLIRFAVGFVMFMKRRWQFNFKNIFFITAAVGGFGGVVYYIMDRYLIFLERTVKRLLLVFDPQSASVAKRFDQIYYSLDQIFDNAVNFLFGQGIGSFGILYENVDGRQYPHNVILEISFELGMIGVILFTLLLLLYFKKLRNNFNFVLIYLFLFLNSLKSHSLVDSRVMFGILSVLLVFHTLLQRELATKDTKKHEEREEEIKGDNDC